MLGAVRWPVRFDMSPEPAVWRDPGSETLPGVAKADW